MLRQNDVRKAVGAWDKFWERSVGADMMVHFGAETNYYINRSVDKIENSITPANLLGEPFAMWWGMRKMKGDKEDD